MRNELKRKQLMAAVSSASQIIEDGRAAGKSQDQILADVLRDGSFVTVLVTVLPVALPLILKIVREMREGKTFFEALLDNIDMVIEVVLAIIPIFIPDEQTGPQINK